MVSVFGSSVRFLSCLHPLSVSLVLAFQVGRETHQFTRLLFGLSLAPSVFTKLVRVVGARLTEAGVSALMYMDDWLIHLLTREGAATSVSVALGLLVDKWFKVNLDKSTLISTQKLFCLGIEWDTIVSSMPLAPGNILRTLRCVRRAYFSHRFPLPSVGGPARLPQLRAPGPLSRLKHRRLTREVSRSVPLLPRDLPRPFPLALHSLLRPWLQSSWGHQACGGGSKEMRSLHINLRELMMVKNWLERHPEVSNISVRFDMDNMTAVQCVQKQGTARSDPLLAL